MLKIWILFAIIAWSSAASLLHPVERVTERREIIPLLKYDRENNLDGSFQYVYEGGDQSYRQETAHVINEGTDEQALEVSGSYRYIDGNGEEVIVHYTAGRNGFVVKGTNIPKEISDAAEAAVAHAEQLRLNDVNKQYKKFQN